MTHVNRYLVVLALLIGIVVCALSIRNVDRNVEAASARVVGLEASVSAMQSTMKASQTAMTQTIDELNGKVSEQELLIVELERIINNLN